MVQASRGVVAPATPHLRSEPWIVASMARATLGDKSVVPWEWMVEDYSRIREKSKPSFRFFKDSTRALKCPAAFASPMPQARESG